MSDLALTQQPDGSFDLSIDAATFDLSSDSGLETAVLLSVFLDRRATPDDVIPDGSADRRGSWQDDYPTVAGNQPGSRLWLLSREKTLPTTLARVKTYLFEALQWLVDDGIAQTVDVTVSWAARGVLAWTVTIEGAPSGRFQRTFQQTLESL